MFDTADGEWLEYTFTTAADGVFDASVRVASTGAGGALHLEVDGQPVTRALAVSVTGGPQVWASVAAPGISVKAGEHVLRVAVEHGGFAMNHVTFETAANQCTDIPPDDRFTCQQQAAWGKCPEAWMAGFCNLTCNRCAP